ncbi:hypothetical protein OWV82_026627 [Melia azedarach]|nr:hypothetical protein OWV82_026627 [Melia azedarach]
MGGGAWPFLVGGAICLVNSVNERDLSLLTSYAEIIAIVGLQRGIPSKRESSARVDYVPALCTQSATSAPNRLNGSVKCSGSRRRGAVNLRRGSLSKPAQQKDPRTRKQNSGGGGGDAGASPPSPLPPPVRRGVETRLAPHAANKTTNPRGEPAPRKIKRESALRLPRRPGHGRGHVCLGVTHRCPPAQSPLGGRGVRVGAETGPPVGSALAVGRNSSPSATGPRRSVVRTSLSSSRSRAPRLRARDSRTLVHAPPGDARFATQVSAGLPAEFKQINKRRKRNLPGFPSNGERTGKSPA